jgi:hypothetical protein
LLSQLINYNDLVTIARQTIQWEGIMKHIFIFVVLILLAGCSLSTAEIPTNITNTQATISTPTPTAIGQISVTPPSDIDNCEGLGGTLEMQVLVGPAEAVGLEPVAVGSIPFSVISQEGLNLLQGGGSILYQDVLEQAWGTYTVDLDLETVMSGLCESNQESGILDMNINVSGEQNVEVIAQGFQGEYPWSGSHDIDLSFPLVEGATAEGEGWIFVLHLNE